MALSGKTVSLDYLIEKIQDTYGFLKDTDVYSVAEHVFDAMALIGVSNSYIRKQTNGLGDNPDPIVIEHHRGELPCDLFELISCKEYENNYSMIADSSTFKQSWDDEDDDSSYPITYHVNNSYIYTKFKDGKVVIEYLAFPTDANNLPLVPDNVRYIKGITSYVAERIGFKLWMNDQLSERKYRHLEQDWLFYVKSAGTAARMPGIDKLESFKNQMARMITNSNHHMFQHKYRNNPEALKAH